VPGAVCEHLTKPVSIYTLARQVRRLLDQPASTRKLPVDAAPSAAPAAPAPDSPFDAFTAASPEDGAPDGTPPGSAPAGGPDPHDASPGGGVPRGGSPGDRPPGAGVHPPVGADQRVLVLHADRARGDLVARMLRDQGVQCELVADGLSTVLDGFGHMRVDLMIVDTDLPRDGLRDLLSMLEKRRASAPALLFLFGDQNRDLRQRASTLPLVDFVDKPFALVETDVRARNLLRTRSYERWIGFVEDEIRNRVAARTAELEEAREEVLRRLAGAAEFRDDVTGRHAERVGILSGLLARHLGMSRERRETLEKAAPLHDLGKIAIPDSILKKSGGLTPAERKVIESHTLVGGQLLAGSRNPIIQAAEEIALTHHEHWDGGGYPRGLSGEAIPESGRIVAVADAFDSLTNHRPYRDGVPLQKALETIRDARGSQFDPRVVDALDRVVENERIEEALNLEIVAYPDAD